MSRTLRLLMLCIPFLVFITLYAIVHRFGIARESLQPWLKTGVILLICAWIILFAIDDHLADIPTGAIFGLLFTDWWMGRRAKVQG